MSLTCKLLGHKWFYSVFGRRCDRCRLVDPLQAQQQMPSPGPDTQTQILLDFSRKQIVAEREARRLGRQDEEYGL